MHAYRLLDAYGQAVVTGTLEACQAAMPAHNGYRLVEVHQIPRAGKLRPALRGTPDYPLTERMMDTIDAHGIDWAIHYYSRRMPMQDLRVLLASALAARGAV